MPLRIRFSSTVFSVAASILLSSPSSFAITYYWDNDGTTAGFGTAAGTWAAPTTGNASQGWSTDSTGSTLPADVTTTTTDVLNFGTATVGLATGTVTVSGSVSTNSLTIGLASGALTFSGGTIGMGGTAPKITANKTGQIIGSALTLNADTSVILGGGTTNTSGALALALNGAIGGTGNLTFTTPNTNFNNADQVISLGAASSYTGNTLITTGNTANRLTVKNTSGAANALPVTTVLTLNGGNGSGSGRNLIFDMNGLDQTLAGLTNNTAVSARNQTVTSTGAATLTVNNSADYSFGRASTHVFSSTTYTTRARIQGAISLVKSGLGTFTLTESHTYTGATTINAGKLQGKLPGSCLNSEVIVAAAGATFGVLITDNTKSWTCDALTTSAAGTLEFDFGAITPSTTVSPLIVTAGAGGGTGEADFTATPTVSIVSDSALPPGTYPLMTWDTASGTVPTTVNLTVSPLGFGTTADIQVTGNTLELVITSTVVTRVKADNTTNLNQGTSWVGGTAPTAGDIAKWNNTVTSANSTVLGADLTWGALVIENPTGPVTIGGPNTLTLGAADTDIDLSSADTANLTLNCNLALGAANVWNVAAGRTLTVGGGVSGNFPLTMQGAGSVRLGAGDVLPDGSGNGNVTVDTTLDLNGNSDAINGLSGAGIVDNATNSTSSTLTVGGNDQSSTFGGILQNTGSTATLNLTKTGTGTLTLSGANTLSGVVAIGNGALVVNNTAPLDNATGITMDDGTTLRPNVDDAVINAPITLGAAGTTATINASNFDGSGTNLVPFTLGGAISGAGNLTLSGVEATNSYGSINLNAASNYTGSTLITAVSGFAGGAPANTNLFVRLGVENALPATTVLTIDGGDGAGSGGRTCQLDLNGNNQTLAGLTNVMSVTARNQTVTNTGALATLTINNSDDYTFGRASVHVFNSVNYTTRARIQGAISLVKSGVGKFTLAEGHTYTGATTITGGTLALASSTALPAASAVSIGAGTLSAGAGVSAATTGTLACTGAATINLVDGTATIAFGDSGAVTWAGALNITGTFVSGASIRFGNDAVDGLSAGQLATKITAAGFTNFSINGSGYLIADAVGGSAYDTWKAQITNGLDERGEDADGDGFTNHQEFLFGTSPIASNGGLSTTEKSGSNLIIRWMERTSGATYTLLQSATLNNDWVISSAVPANDGAAAGDYQPRMATVAISAGKLFFRIQGVEN